MTIGTITLNTSIDKLYVIDALYPYEVSRVKSVNNTAGGKGLNVARVAALTGEDVIVGGFVGGFNGMYLKSLITQPNIEQCFTQVNGETRSCINLWDSKANKSTEFLEPGGFILTEEDFVNFLADYEKITAKSDVICISGSFPIETPQNFVQELIKTAKSKSKHVLVDTTGSALKEAYCAAPTMMKPNTDEVVQLFNADVGSLTSIAHAAKKMHGNNIEIAAISLGAKGVVVACDKGCFHVSPPKLNVVNTVGSGDSMMAGFAVGIAKGMELTDTMKYACAIASANTLSFGTGSFLQKDFEEILPQVTIKEI